MMARSRQAAGIVLVRPQVEDDLGAAVGLLDGLDRVVTRAARFQRTPCSAPSPARRVVRATLSATMKAE